MDNNHKTMVGKDVDDDKGKDDSILLQFDTAMGSSATRVVGGGDSDAESHAALTSLLTRLHQFSTAAELPNRDASDSSDHHSQDCAAYGHTHLHVDVVSNRENELTNVAASVTLQDRLSPPPPHRAAQTMDKNITTSSSSNVECRAATEASESASTATATVTNNINSSAASFSPTLGGSADVAQREKCASNNAELTAVQPSPVALSQSLPNNATVEATMNGMLCSSCGSSHHDSSTCPLRFIQIECHQCHQQGHIMKTCPRIRCYNCGVLGHSSQVCYSEPHCFQCSSSGHRSSSCPIKYKGRVCYQCREPGHEAARCPQVQICRLCHNKGHAIEQCPELLVPGTIITTVPLVAAGPTPGLYYEVGQVSERTNIINQPNNNGINLTNANSGNNNNANSNNAILSEHTKINNNTLAAGNTSHSSSNINNNNNSQNNSVHNASVLITNSLHNHNTANTKCDEMKVGAAVEHATDQLTALSVRDLHMGSDSKPYIPLDAGHSSVPNQSRGCVAVPYQVPLENAPMTRAALNAQHFQSHPRATQAVSLANPSATMSVNAHAVSPTYISIGPAGQPLPMNATGLHTIPTQTADKVLNGAASGKVAVSKSNTAVVASKPASTKKSGNGNNNNYNNSAANNSMVTKVADLVTEVPMYIASGRPHVARVAIVIDGPYFERCLNFTSRNYVNASQYYKLVRNALRSTLTYLGDIFGNNPIAYWFDCDLTMFADFVAKSIVDESQRESTLHDIIMRQRYLIDEMNGGKSLHNVVARLVGSVKKKVGYVKGVRNEEVWVHTGVDVALSTCAIELFQDQRHVQQVVLLCGSSDLYPTMNFCNTLRRNVPAYAKHAPLRLCAASTSISHLYGFHQDLSDFLPHILLNRTTHEENGNSYQFPTAAVFR